MSSPKDLSTLATNGDALNSSNRVIILSHDLDDYSMLSYSVRREFSIGGVSSLIVSNPDLSIPPITAGLQFTKFMGREVSGYFCPPESLMAGNLLNDVSGAGLTIIQLLPELQGYSRLRAIIRSLDENKPSLATALVTDGELMKNAQKVSETGFINLIGVFMSMTGVRDNPFVDSDTKEDWIRSSQVEKILSDPKFMLDFFKEKGIGYIVHRFDPLNASLRLMKKS